MTAAGDSPDVDRQALFEDLYDALAEFRPSAHLGTMAQRLLRWDRDCELVALVDEGERVVFYRPDLFTVVACPFDVSGVEVGDAETLWRRACDPAAWVDANVDWVDWVHPFYRWILDLDEEQTTWAFLRTVEDGRLENVHLST